MFDKEESGVEYPSDSSDDEDDNANVGDDISWIENLAGREADSDAENDTEGGNKPH